MRKNEMEVQPRSDHHREAWKTARREIRRIQKNNGPRTDTGAIELQQQEAQQQLLIAALRRRNIVPAAGESQP